MADRRQQWARALGTVVQGRRLKKGLSQETFADLCGIHRTFVSMLERGKRLPSLEIVERLASGLDVTTSALVRLVERELGS